MRAALSGGVVGARSCHCPGRTEWPYSRLYCLVGTSASAEAVRVCRLNVAPATRKCNLQPEHADRLAVARRCPSRKSVDLRGIDDRDAAAALDLERLVRADERGGVLVQADADRERVVGQRRDQAAEAVALRGNAGR